jgi:uncharacterized iron-regulated protein
MRSAWVLVLFGCAHSTTPPPAATATPPAATAPAEPPHHHGEKGAHEPIALPHRVVDGASGGELDGARLAERLRAARVIYVGEEHPNPHHHAVELEVLEAAFAIDPSLGLGLEMLPRTMQAPLDRFLDGTLDEAQFLEQVRWDETWGYAWGFYRPLLVFCREHHLRAWALNASHDLAHAVARGGVAGLTAEQRRQLPELVPGPAAHRELVREAFAAHPHDSRFTDASFERFYTAQLVWDETMGERVAAALGAPTAPHRLVVVAGEGHVRRFAVPDRAARRGARPFVTIFPVLDDELDDARKDDAADLFWVLRAG